MVAANFLKTHKPTIEEIKMSLELIKIKVKNLPSNNFRDYYINKADIVALTKVAEDHDDQGCEYILTVRNFKELVLFDKGNSQLFSTVMVASTDKFKVIEKISKIKQLIQSEKDKFQTETGHYFHSFPEECFNQNDEDLEKMNKVWDQCKKNISVNEAMIKILDAQLYDAPATLNTVRNAIYDLTDQCAKLTDEINLIRTTYQSAKDY